MQERSTGAIAVALGEAIARGELRPGDRLPTHRDLAQRLGQRSLEGCQVHEASAIEVSVPLRPQAASGVVMTTSACGACSV